MPWRRSGCLQRYIHNGKMVSFISLKKLYVSDIRCFYHTVIGENCTRDRIIMENCGVILLRA